MPRPKPLAKPSKKSKAPPVPQTPDDYQAQADDEESRGGKWRAGDPAKSARAFQRALALYDAGTQQFPADFDLAYNKARLQLEVSQQPTLLPHWGASHAEFLAETLVAHRRALALNDGEVDLLFNTAQVLISLAEELSSLDQSVEAVPLLHETLELLSSCLAKQEMLLEQQSIDEADDADAEGGVSVGGEDTAPVGDSTAEEVTATVIQPVTANDLLDTVHSSLSALTTLLPLEGEQALPNLETMAHTLVDQKAPAYIQLLSTDDQQSARFAVALDRAIFTCALANARFTFHDMDLKTYAGALSSFDIPGKQQHAQALSNEAEAKSELVLSALDRMTEDTSIPITDCWRQLSQAQDLLTTATKLDNEDAKDVRPRLYKQKGDVELLRVRIAALPSPHVTEAMRNSGTALLKNASTFYKAAMGFATSANDEALAIVSADRLAAVQFLIGLNDQQQPPAAHGLSTVFADIADEGLVDNSLLERLSAMLN